MSPPDFEKYQQLKPELTAKTDANTWALPGTPTAVGGDPSSTRVHAVSGDELRDTLGHFQDHHVLYLTAPIAVQQSERPGWHDGTCVPHCEYEAIAPGLTKLLERFESIQGCHPFKGYLLPERAPARGLLSGYE
jgi:hypothetical protein